MNAETIVELREGDIYRWSYREPGDDRQYGRYHCCSQIGIVKKGRLTDTYWFGSDNRSFGPKDLGALNLTRLGNMEELIKAPVWQAEYYDDADIVNLNHANSSNDNFYLRVGAQRSLKKMLESAKAKLDRAESDKRMAEWKIERIAAEIAKIEAGQTEGVHL